MISKALEFAITQLVAASDPNAAAANTAANANTGANANGAGDASSSQSTTDAAA